MHHDELGPLMRRRPVATIEELSDDIRHRVRDLVAQFTPTAAAS